MKKFTVAAGLLASCTWAQADAGFMLGISHNFGGSTGLTFKVLSSNKQDRGVVALGVSYFPGDDNNKFGVDLGVGYNFRRGAATVGWDFLHQQVQAAIGFSDTKKPPPPPAPAASPPPPSSDASAALDRFLDDSPTSLA